MKKKLVLATTVVLTVLFASCSKPAALTSTSGADYSFIEDVPTVQGYTDEAVADADIKKILQAGINCQSAINKQPWHFTAITNPEIGKEIAAEMKNNMPKPPAGEGMPKPPAGAVGPKANIGDTPLTIIVSGKEGSDLDAGLATQIMAVEAYALGYGSKIITSPTIVLNGPNSAAYKARFGIPDDMSVKSVILIGKYDKSKADAVTSATVRNPMSEIVTFVK